MTDLPSSGGVTSKGDLYARDIITGIQQNFTLIFQQPFQPPADLDRCWSQRRQPWNPSSILPISFNG